MATTDWSALVADIVAHYGNQQKAAAALGVSQSAVSHWLTGDRTPAGLYRRELLRHAKKVTKVTKATA